MKIGVTSDIHGVFPPVEECDIFLICGDISPINDNHSYDNQKRWFMDHFVPYLSMIKAKHIAFIAGNHDYFLYSVYRSNSMDIIKDVLPKNAHYLCDSHVNFDGVVVYGSPWVNRPYWGNRNAPIWSFSGDGYNEMLSYYDKIPKDVKVDIVISHSPLYGVCDKIDWIGDNHDDEHLGSRELIRIIRNRAPRYSFFGHIHSGSHEYESFLAEGGKSQILARNVAFLGENYKPAYPIHYFDVSVDKID